MDRWQEKKAIIKGAARSATSQRFDHKYQAEKASSTFYIEMQFQGVNHR